MTRLSHVGSSRFTAKLVVVMLAGASLHVIAGCPVADDRLSNQGGGSLASAVAKINGGRMTSLTPDEVQILGDAGSELSPDVDVFIEDDQAQAAVDFLVVNEIRTVDDVVALAELAAADSDSIIIPPSLQNLIDSGIGVSDIIDVSGDIGVIAP